MGLGIGYRLSPEAVFKTEYTWEEAKSVTGERRKNEDLFSAQAAVSF
jgi:hypothetical protein